MFTTIQERTGKTIDDMNPPDFPDEVEYLWLQYVEIRKGAVQIGYAEIDHYGRVTGCELTPWESEIIMKIDKARLKDHE